MKKHEEYLKELLKHVKSDSILIIDSESKLKRIYCPFNVIVIRLIPDLMVGDIAVVDAVKITLELKDVYIIRGKAYYIWNFKIIVWVMLYFLPTFLRWLLINQTTEKM